MKKKITAFILTICIVAVILPTTSSAAVTPYFMAVNDLLLPFNYDTMPYVVGSEIFVPYNMFGYGDAQGLRVYSIAAAELERGRIYTGSDRYVDFYTDRGITEDQDGNTLAWPSVRRIGNSFYVPLRHVCAFFGLSHEILPIGRDIIDQEQMWVIRITHTEGFTGLNGPTFVSINRSALRAAYNEFYTLPALPSTSIPGATVPTPPATVPGSTTPGSTTPGSTIPGTSTPGTTTPAESPPQEDEEMPPTFNDVTIHHSF